MRRYREQRTETIYTMVTYRVIYNDKYIQLYQRLSDTELIFKN